MQKIVVLGDTHANFRYLNRIVAEEHPDIIFVCAENNTDWRIVIAVVDLICVIVEVHIKLTYRIRH